MEDLDLVVRKDQYDRCLLFIASGTLIRCNDKGPNDVLKMGTILGVEQFLYN